MKCGHINILSAWVVSLLLASCSSALQPIEPVTSVDLPRFMGRWYVIAAIPTPASQAAHNAVETYRLTPDGEVCTWFRFRQGSFISPVDLIHSTASIKANSGNAEWTITFFWLFQFQYLVGWLNADYSQVLIVRDDRDYLWYMARQPRVSSADYHAMLKRAQAFGYDIRDIVKIPQRWPETGPGRHTLAGNCP